MHVPRPSEQRVPPVQRVYERLSKEGHGAANLYATLATNKTASNAMAGVMTYLFYGENAQLDERTRELIVLRLAWNTLTVYHFGQHTAIARNSDISDDEIFLTTRPLSEGTWSPRDVAVLQMVDDLYADDFVTDATWRDLSEHFGNEDIMAMMVLSGAYRMHAAVINSFGVQLDEGIPTWPTGKSD
jgi:4-carboxymuconolactone decarboxylase